MCKVAFTLLYGNDIEYDDDNKIYSEEKKKKKLNEQFRSIDEKYKFMNVISISGSALDPLN